MEKISDQLVAAGVHVLDARRIEIALFSGLILSAEDAYQSLQFGPQYDEEAVQEARNGWWTKQSIPDEYRRILDAQTTGEIEPELYELDEDLLQAHKGAPEALLTHVARQYQARATQWRRLTGETPPDLPVGILRDPAKMISFVFEHDHPSTLYPIAIVKAYLCAIANSD